jgi:hypothetical protein
MFNYLTATGLQHLINTTTTYIESHGLRFNPSKTSCVTFGPHTLQPRPKWYMNGVVLDETDTSNYLGVTLGNTAKCHIDNRIQSTRKSFYCLQSAGLCSGGISSDSMRCVWNAAIRPVLSYGLSSIHVPGKYMDTIEKTQSKLMKAAIGLSKYCRNTPLLKAMKIHRISLSCDIT